MAYKYAKLKKLEIDHIPISSSDVAGHLQDLLGFSFDCDFQIWDNRMDYEKPINTNKCYVIMRCAFRPQDILMMDKPKDYVDSVLRATSAGTQFKDSFIKTIKPFMFPEEIKTESRPEVLQKLAEMGIYGDRLDMLRSMPGLFYDQVTDRWGVFLRPEAIIGDMVKDPTEDKIDGTMQFGWVSGDPMNSATVNWGANIYKGRMFNGNNSVALDAVFNAIRR